jgi:hypothetical protein
MTLEASFLGKDAVRTQAGCYEVDIHLPWYRSLPLSCVESIEVTIDGDTPARKDLHVRAGGEEFTLDALEEMDEAQWFVQDPLTVIVPAAAPKPAGDAADVRVAIAVRIPYIIIGPETALVQNARVARKVRVS